MLKYKSAVCYVPGDGERKQSDNYYFNSKVISEEVNKKIRALSKMIKEEQRLLFHFEIISFLRLLQLRTERFWAVFLLLRRNVRVWM